MQSNCETASVGLENIVEPLRALAVPVVDLALDDENARTHDQRNLEAISASLRKFGQRKPIVILDDGKIIAGNGTYVAARALGWPVIAAVRVKDDPTTARAYALADNRTAELAEWNRQQLAITIDALMSEDYDPVDIGFSEDDVAALQHYLDRDVTPSAEVQDTLSNNAKTDPVGEIKKHLENDLRYVQLFYPQVVHDEVMGILRAACEKFGVDNNSDAVLKILREYHAAD